MTTEKKQTKKKPPADDLIQMVARITERLPDDIERQVNEAIAEANALRAATIAEADVGSDLDAAVQYMTTPALGLLLSEIAGIVPEPNTVGGVVAVVIVAYRRYLEQRHD